MSPTNDPIAQRRFAFRLVPQCELSGHEWRVSYPGADWWVSASSEDEARRKFADEVTRRRDAGENPTAFAESVYRRHLEEAIPGVYAMDSQLYRYLIREVGYDEEALQKVFEESERRRGVGAAYTKDDYIRDPPDGTT